MLVLEFFIGALSLIIFFGALAVACFIPLKTWISVLIGVFGFIILIVGTLACLYIEQVAGFYECTHCHNRYVPNYLRVFFAMHVNRTRYMKCPKCKKRSWQKKVIEKE